MRLKVINILDVVESQMCCGCGACAYIDPDHVTMLDAPDYGRRPVVSRAAGQSLDGALLDVCPGIGLSHPPFIDKSPIVKSLLPGWGPVLELWEGHATDSELRFAASSGGAASALAIFCMEHQGMHGTLHIAARDDVPYLNETVMSHTREQMLANTGSRYAPASPCDGLQKIEDAPSPCVFIGKPCDVAGANKAAALRPKLAEKLGLTIAIFCAGTPSTRGTLEMIKAMGVADPSAVTSVRYRGNGWPGMAVATEQGPDGNEIRHEMTYAESWGDILQKHRQWRCYICPDHTGEFADIAVGDPWYREICAGEPGKSLVAIRSERGRQIFHEAVRAGVIEMEPRDPSVLVASQPNLLATRGAVWGRIWTSWLLGAARPIYCGMPQFRFWLKQLSFREKVSSVGGTIKRVFRKKLNQRLSIRYDSRSS